MLYTAPHVSIDAGHDGKSTLKTSFFTFMIDSGTQAALVLLTIFEELEPIPVEPPSRYFQHAHFIPIVGVGKRGEY